MATAKKERRANGDGSLYYNEKKDLWIVQVTYYDPTGSRKRKSFSSHSRNNAIQKKNEFMDKVGKREINSTSDETLKSIIMNFMNREHLMNHISESTYTRKLHTYKIIEKSNIGNVSVVDITDVDIDIFLSSLVHYSNSVISKVFALAKKGFDIACEEHIIYMNPLRKTTIIKPKSIKNDKKVRAFTFDEQKNFLKALEGYSTYDSRVDYRYQWLLELFTGMRMGEINALSKEDIDFNNSLIHVRKTITVDSNYRPVLNKTTKTKAGIRDVPMNEKAKELLMEVMKNYKNNANHLLFYDHINKKLITTNQVNSGFFRFCEKYDLPFYGQHMLRHTYATRCIEAGVRAEVLMRWLGHTDISVTINTYCDVFAKMNNDHISKLDDYLKTFDSKTEDFFDYLPVAPEKEKNVVPHDNISYSSTYLVTI